MTEDEKARDLQWFLMEKGATKLSYMGKPKAFKDWERRQEKKRQANRERTLARSGRGPGVRQQDIPPETVAREAQRPAAAPKANTMEEQTIQASALSAGIGEALAAKGGR